MNGTGIECGGILEFQAPVTPLYSLFQCAMSVQIHRLIAHASTLCFNDYWSASNIGQ